MHKLLGEWTKHLEKAEKGINNAKREYELTRDAVDYLEEMLDNDMEIRCGICQIGIVYNDAESMYVVLMNNREKKLQHFHIECRLTKDNEGITPPIKTVFDYMKLIDNGEA